MTSLPTGTGVRATCDAGRRSPRRVAALVAAPLLLGLPATLVAANQPAAAVTETAAQRVASAQTTTCPDVLVLQARGSGQKSGPGEQVADFTRHLRRELGRAVGTRALTASEYPARDVSALIDQRVDGNVYFKGLRSGVRSGRKLLVATAAACLDQKIVLAGYSQGAMVWHRVVNGLVDDGRAAVVDRVTGIALIADGDKARDTRSHLVGAPKAPDSSRGVGRFNLKSRDVARRVAARTWTLCTATDLVCDFRWWRALARRKEAAAVHTGRTYLDNARPLRAAAAGVAAQIRAWPHITTPSSLPAATEGAPYQQRLDTRDGRAGVWSVSAGALPTGLTLNKGDGTISGTVAPGTPTIAFTVSFTDAKRRRTGKVFTLPTDTPAGAFRDTATPHPKLSPNALFAVSGRSRTAPDAPMVLHDLSEGVSRTLLGSDGQPCTDLGYDHTLQLTDDGTVLYRCAQSFDLLLASPDRPTPDVVMHMTGDSAPYLSGAALSGNGNVVVYVESAPSSDGTQQKQTLVRYAVSTGARTTVASWSWQPTADGPAAADNLTGIYEAANVDGTRVLANMCRPDPDAIFRTGHVCAAGHTERPVLYDLTAGSVTEIVPPAPAGTGASGWVSGWSADLGTLTVGRHDGGWPTIETHRWLSRNGSRTHLVSATGEPCEAWSLYGNPVSWSGRYVFCMGPVAGDEYADRLLRVDADSAEILDVSDGPVFAGASRPVTYHVRAAPGDGAAVLYVDDPYEGSYYGWSQP